MIGSERYTCRGSCPCMRTDRFPGGLKPCARICTHDGPHECEECKAKSRAKTTTTITITAQQPTAQQIPYTVAAPAVAEAYRAVLAANKVFSVTRIAAASTRKHTDKDIVSRFL